VETKRSKISNHIKMARDILSVPVSTVASESAFSTAGLMVDKNRCSLLPTTFKALMCTQDWLRADIPGIYLYSHIFC